MSEPQWSDEGGHVGEEFEFLPVPEIPKTSLTSFLIPAYLDLDITPVTSRDAAHQLFLLKPIRVGHRLL